MKRTIIIASVIGISVGLTMIFLDYSIPRSPHISGFQLTHNTANDGWPSFSPDGRKIVFCSDRDGDLEIFVMNADGSDETQLTNNNAVDWRPIFSPEGHKILFTSDRDGDFEIFVMNADGSDEIQLTNNTWDDLDPNFNHDGSRIIFYSSNRIIKANENPTFVENIFVMNTDGSGQAQLTTNNVSRYPIFTPDGKKIMFEAKYETMIMNVDGINRKNLLIRSAPNSQLSFSPDGNKIVYLSPWGFVSYAISVANIDGSEETRLTSSGTHNGDPSFSPDGNYILFSSIKESLPFNSSEIHDYEIFIMDIDGSGKTQLTNNTSGDYRPYFSPDGSKIVFESDRDGDFEIFILKNKGGRWN